MKTAIVTDSGAYLTKTEIAALGVRVVPLTVIFGTEELFENETITSGEFYARLQNSKDLPTTAQAPLYRLDEAYQALAKEGYDAVLSIHLSGALSGMVDSLRAFTRDYEPIKVYVYDSRSISTGEANQVKLAARMLAAGATPQEVMVTLAAYNEQVSVNFVVDDLRHLLRTGRISSSTAFLGNILAIKPVLVLKDGAIVPTSKERTAKRALLRIAKNAVAAAEQINGPVRFTIIDANNTAGAALIRNHVASAFAGGTIERGVIGPAIGVHTGAGVVGIFTAPDWESFPIK
ncbi:DegV family protein [Lacticaseibacillus zhaodongensis]|uniref:DegV family protein n=1 Tax=Lacticaseibacillus zhaodongensis TaxID=2668065 RepID=UPI0018AFE8CC|nr:DegV family protein [Lacticaseibacillus zhaodongensis]